jgi:hypothetical protein
MVKSTLRGLLVLLIVLPLASCIFFYSAFSPLLTQVTVRTDLSSIIPDAHDYQVYCVTAYAPPRGEFVILMNRNATAEPRIVVLDANLSLIQTYTTAWLNTWGFSGSIIMEEAAQNIEIGSYGFSTTNLLTVGTNPSWTGRPPIFNPSFGSFERQKDVINFQVTGGNTLSYSQWDWMWAPLDFNAVIGIKSPADTQFEVVGVYNAADSSTGGTVILVLSERDSSAIDIVALPLDDVCTNALAAPLFDNYPHARYSNIETSSVGFAGDCLVAFSYQDMAMVRYSLTPPFDVLSKVPVSSSKQLIYGYKADGRYSVQLDPRTRMLSKVAKWW